MVGNTVRRSLAELICSFTYCTEFAGCGSVGDSHSRRHGPRPGAGKNSKTFNCRCFSDVVAAISVNTTRLPNRYLPHNTSNDIQAQDTRGAGRDSVGTKCVNLLPCCPCFHFFTCMFYQLLGVQHSCSEVVHYHILLRRETRIPGVAPFSFRIGIWDLFVHRGQKSYTPTAFGKLWTTPGVRCMKRASS